MAYKELNPRVEISGFYKFSEKNPPLEGRLLKFIDKGEDKKGNRLPGSFFLFTLVAECEIITETEDGKHVEERTAEAGEVVGIGYSSNLACLTRLPVDTQVRITFTGTVPSRRFKGKDVKLFKVEVDE